MRISVLRIVNRTVFIAGVVVFYAGATPPPEYDSATARKVVKSLDLAKFRADDKALADMGDRLYGSASNTTAQQWLQKQLEGYGYKVTLQSSTYKNVMCSKVGSVAPDSGYIIGAHYDGRSGGGAADDNASGTSLILEAARVFFDPAVKTHYSIRFVMFNSEETGLNGSNAYVNERKSLQGKEDPPGSKLYPEPVWRGAIVHDMVLFDHGVPPQGDQIPGADIDVEYKAGTTFEKQSQALAQALVTGASTFSANYPAGTGSNMAMTDSDPFKNLVAAVSVRENQRMSEIGAGSNPHYHTNTDNYEVYSDKDFLLGFNAVQMTVGTLCMLAGVFDSTTTGSILNPGANKHFLQSPVVKEACVFDTRGKLVAELKGPCDRRMLEREIAAGMVLPPGLYIIRLIQAQGPAQTRFVRVLYE